MDDFELLQAYATRRAEDAFSTLTGRYINLVYSAATRQSFGTQMAEDVTQAVFLTLARKAGSISRNTILAGWLLRTTRFAAANARRLEERRQHYEQQAMHSYICPTESEAAWQRIAPVLDEALDRLGEKDRDAIVLRFLEQKSLKQVAEKLGLSEDGAQKRVSRALEKLRLFFTQQGKGVSAGVLGSALVAHSVQAAPPALVASISGAVGTHSVLATSAVGALAEATVSTLARLRLQSLAVRVGSVAILLGLAILIVRRATEPPASTNSSALRALPAVLGQPPARAAVAAIALPAQADGKTLLLHVLDAQSGEPVTNAQLTLVSTVESPRRTTNTFMTDAKGTSLISYSPVPVKSWNHRIEIFRDGYVPKYVSWSESQQDQMEEIPQEYTVKVDRAVRIGGVVVDEMGAAVADLRVVFTVMGPIDSRSRERLTMMGNYHTEVTDAAGKWHCTHVPARFAMITYRLIHPQFQETTYVSDSPETPAYSSVERVPEADLLADRALMRVKPGLTIAGRVTEENGSPVAGAKVTQGFDFYRPERTMLTAADGSFHFRNGRARELSLTVQAAGLAPVVTSFVMNASVENLQFTLPPGRTLRGRVVDETGMPLIAATIEAASPTADSRTLFEGRAKTDSEGNFTWEGAPAVQEYAVYASGYETQSRLTLTADGTEQLIQMKKKENVASVRIIGQILDGETQLPAPAASIQIWETSRQGNRVSSFTTRPANAAADGRFRLKASSGTFSYVLEAQAEGYWPQRLTNQISGTTEIEHKIELKKAPVRGGVVLTPAGEAASGATLAVCGPNEWAQMNQAGRLQLGSSGAAGTVADAQGRFRVPAKHSPEVLVVAHTDGFAELRFSDVSSNTVITLQPWGRLEGVARIGTKPLVGETIRLDAMPWRVNRVPRVALYRAATTDAEGRFAFESVPPAEWKVQREINVRPEGSRGIHIPAFSHGTPVLVRPGETVEVTVGGAGGTVVGKAILANPNRSIPWTDNAVTLTLKVPTPDLPQRPSQESFTTEQAFRSAMTSYSEQNQSYWTSSQGMAMLRLQRDYRAMFANDGAFRIEGVPGGDYTLKISLTDPPKSPGSDMFDPAIIGSLEMNVTVPAGGDADEVPVDLGVLQLSPGPAQHAKN